MHPAEQMAEIVNAFGVIIGAVVRRLELTGALGGADLAAELMASADEAERVLPEHVKAQRKIALDIVRHVAAVIERHRNSDNPQGWVPVVIEGGLESPKPEGD